MPPARSEQSSRVATVEDWDDEADQVRPGTCTAADVAGRRGVLNRPHYAVQSHSYQHVDADSGYGSKAPTISSMNSGRQRDTDTTTEAVVLERGKQPAVQAPRHASKLQPSDRLHEKPNTTKHFCHRQGICWVCDKYGFHFDPAGGEETRRKNEKTNRTLIPRVKKEDPARPTVSRRMSSSSGARPQSMYVGTPPQQSYMQYSMPTQGWATGPPPTSQQSAAYGSYYTAPMISVDNYPSQHVTCYEAPGVYDQRAPRTSGSSCERPALGKMRARTSTVIEQGSSYRKEPVVTSHRPSRSVDVDRVKMPPPPRPVPISTVPTRPRHDRASTYHSNTSGQRYSRHHNEEDGYVEDDEEVSCLDEGSYLEHRPSNVDKQVPTVSSRVPPTAYRGKTLPDVTGRPVIKQKSRSYTNGSKQVEVTAAPICRGDGSGGGESMPRRRTIDSVQLEQREANIEAYLRKRGSVPSTDLTVENLKRASRSIDTHSEAGSTASHHTHHSSSRGSAVGSGSGRGRGLSSIPSHDQKHANTNMNININGLSLSIANDGSDTSLQQPVTIDLGGVQISMGGSRDKENIDTRRDHKRLERAPSTSSNPSRRSFTSNGAGTVREQMAAEAAARERNPRRRSGYITEEEAEVVAAAEAERRYREAVRKSNKSSRQASRNPSMTRHDDEIERDRFGPRTSNRGSIDFTIRE